MANNLKAYVKRTILESAREYAGGNRRTKESTKGAFMDALHGTDSGWWSDLIYTADMLKMAHKYRRDIATALDEYRDEIGESYTCRVSDDNNISADRIYSALLRGPYSFEDYRGESDKAVRADCAIIGLRFAVEWFAGQLARDYCPDL